MTSTFVFKSLKEFNDWFASGGAFRAGLQPEKLQPMDDAVLVYRTRLRQVVHDLERHQATWQRIETARTTGMATILFRKLTIGLAVLNDDVDDLLRAAAEIRAKIQSTRPMLQARIKENRGKIAAAERALEEARRKQAQARSDLQAAKKELTGDKGFWNHVATVVTLTIYNPVKENIDKLNDAVRSINETVGRTKNQIQILNRSTSELCEANHSLNSINAVNEALADYQNFLTQAQGALQGAHADAQKSAGTNSGRLGAHYRKRAEKEMTELFGWIDAFKAAR